MLCGKILAVFGQCRQTNSRKLAVLTWGPHPPTASPLVAVLLVGTPHGQHLHVTLLPSIPSALTASPVLVSTCHLPVRCPLHCFHASRGPVLVSPCPSPGLSALPPRVLWPRAGFSLPQSWALCIASTCLVGESGVTGKPAPVCACCVTP